MRLRHLLFLLLLAARPEAHSQTPPPPTAEESKAGFISSFQKASEAYAKGDYAAASRLADKALNEAPSSGQAFVLKGAVLTKQGKLEDAKDYFQKAVAALPGRWEPRFNLVELLYWQKRYTEARSQYLGLLKEYPKEANIKFRIFLTYLHDGLEADAQKILEAADPFADDPLFYMTRAAMDFHHKKDAEATEWIQSANRIYPAAALINYVDSMVDEGWIRRGGQL